MFKRKPVAYALMVAALLITAVIGSNSFSAQAQTTPAATPLPQEEPAAQIAQPSDPTPMMGAMLEMLDQMQAMMAVAPDDAARQQMAPAMMNALNGLMGLNQTMMEQMKSMPDADRQAMTGPMMEAMTRMTGMMGQMQPMMGRGRMGATNPMTGTMPMTGSQSMKPMGGGMPMDPMMGMMGQMMQMMGQMHGMMGEGMMGGSSPISGTMPMTGSQSMKPMGGGMQMGQMMQMMGQMMQMMGQMMQMMGQMHGMMGGQGMGQMGSSSSMTGTAPIQTPPSAGAETTVTGEAAPQSIEGGGVTVKVTPLTLTDATATTLDFEVVLDTHSGELNYDLAELALLRDNLGNEYQPAAWTPGENTGHHVSGLLSFADRAKILQTGVTALELDVTEIAAVPSRIFSWGVGE